MSALARTWLTTHAAAATGFGLVGLMTLTWSVAQGVIQDRLTNPLGDSYAALSVTLILPVLAVALLPAALHDRVDPVIALAARPVRALRAAWWLASVTELFVALHPVQGLIGPAQLRVDIGLLAGLATLLLCAVGLGPALAVPLLVLVPHLARHTGAPLRWWTVLSTPYLAAMQIVATGAALAGLLAYALVGPRTHPDLAGGGAD